MQRAPAVCVGGGSLEEVQHCSGLVSTPEVSDCSTSTAPAIKRSAVASKPLARKRQRSASHNSFCEDWSSSETCMSERAASHSYASSSSSSASSSPLQSESHEAPPLSDWHTLAKPVPATFREIARLQPNLQTQNLPSSRWDLLCAVEFSPDGAYLAAAGVGKKVSLAVAGRAPTSRIEGLAGIVTISHPCRFAYIPLLTRRSNLPPSYRAAQSTTHQS